MAKFSSAEEKLHQKIERNYFSASESIGLVEEGIREVNDASQRLRDDMINR